MTEEPILIQIDEVQMWLGPRMGRTNLSAKVGALVLTPRHVVFLTRGGSGVLPDATVEVARNLPGLPGLTAVVTDLTLSWGSAIGNRVKRGDWSDPLPEPGKGSWVIPLEQMEGCTVTRKWWGATLTLIASGSDGSGGPAAATLTRRWLFRREAEGFQATLHDLVPGLGGAPADPG